MEQGTIATGQASRARTLVRHCSSRRLGHAGCLLNFARYSLPDGRSRARSKSSLSAVTKMFRDPLKLYCFGEIKAASAASARCHIAAAMQHCKLRSLEVCKHMLKLTLSWFRSMAQLMRLQCTGTSGLCTCSLTSTWTVQ